MESNPPFRIALLFRGIPERESLRREAQRRGWIVEGIEDLSQIAPPPEGPQALIVDLEALDDLSKLPRFLPTWGVYPHLRGDLRDLARSMGCTPIARGAFFGNLEKVFDRIEKEATLDSLRERRYLRQITLRGMGRRGQRLLLRSKALVVGAGATGTLALLGIVGAGVGTVGVADDDVIEESNLSRQVLYGEQDVGRPKVEVIAERLSEINPLVEIRPIPRRVGPENAQEILSEYDIVVDATDFLPTKLELNRRSRSQGIPLVYTSALSMVGVVGTLSSPGPCLECLFPNPPPPEMCPTCEEEGILGPVAHAVGSLGASEVVRILSGMGGALVGKLVVLDMSTGSAETFSWARRPGCKVCEERQVEEVGAQGRIERLSPEEFEEARRRGGGVVVDVRTPLEQAQGMIEGSLSIPLGELRKRAGEIPREALVLLVCRSGRRSELGAAVLQQLGFPRVATLVGGLRAYRERIDPSFVLD